MHVIRTEQLREKLSAVAGPKGQKYLFSVLSQKKCADLSITEIESEQWDLNHFPFIYKMLPNFALNVSLLSAVNLEKR